MSSSVVVWARLWSVTVFAQNARFFVYFFSFPHPSLCLAALSSLFIHGFGTVIWDKVALKLNPLPVFLPRPCHPPCLTSLEWAPSWSRHANTDPPFEPCVIFDNILRWAGAPISGCDESDPRNDPWSSVFVSLFAGSCMPKRPPAGSRLLTEMENHCSGSQKKNFVRWCCQTARREKTGIRR